MATNHATHNRATPLADWIKKHTSDKTIIPMTVEEMFALCDAKAAKDHMPINRKKFCFLVCERPVRSRM
jgi:hypothetical protein